jgi:hypothetical protein
MLRVVLVTFLLPVLLEAVVVERAATILQTRVVVGWAAEAVVFGKALQVEH